MDKEDQFLWAKKIFFVSTLIALPHLKKPKSHVPYISLYTALVQ